MFSRGFRKENVEVETFPVCFLIFSIPLSVRPACEMPTASQLNTITPLVSQSEAVMLYSHKQLFLAQLRGSCFECWVKVLL